MVSCNDIKEFCPINGNSTDRSIENYDRQYKHTKPYNIIS